MLSVHSKLVKVPKILSKLISIESLDFVFSEPQSIKLYFLLIFSC